MDRLTPEMLNNADCVLTKGTVNCWF